MGAQGHATRLRAEGRRRSIASMAVAAVLLLAGPAQADYTVQPDDTLGHIAVRHGTSVSALIGANSIRNPHLIMPGTVLRIPSGRGGDAASSGGGGGTHHVVRPGETLSAISLRYGVPSSQLVEWNGLRSANLVMAGSRISVSGPAAPNVAGSSGGAGSHTLRSGETLSHVAIRTGVSISEIARANGISDPNRVRAGTALTIPAAGRWHCPVRGSVRFVNDFGYTKPGGRFHNGVDIYAAHGTPVVAPVAGRVEQIRGEVAGLQVTLHGADGHVYIGTHLDSFGAAGQVQAGTVIGTVGSSGNAAGTPPHLHFEIHTGGQRIVNPYPSLRSACG